MTSADVMFYNGPAITIAPSLWIKARLTTKPLIWKSFFYYYAEQKRFHNKDFALSLVFKVRGFEPQKWSIQPEI